MGIKATQGPYHLGFAKSGARYIYGTSGEQPIKPNVRVNKTTSPEIVATATLFAASWDLYQVLVEASSYLESYWHGDHAGRPLAEKIRKAIEKAETVAVQH